MVHGGLGFEFLQIMGRRKLSPEHHDLQVFNDFPVYFLIMENIFKNMPSQHRNARKANNKGHAWGTWVAQSVKCPTLAQVMISRFLSLSPVLGSLAVGTEPALDPVSPSLSAPLLFVLSFSLKNK